MKKEIKVLVEASGRHVHMTEEVLHQLFGADAVLEKKKQLGGDYLSTSKVEVVGADGKSCMCSVLGPCRKFTQAEFSYTEARAIGLCPPVADSGILAGTDKLIMKGPAGTVELDEGLFVARRHIHMCWDHAQELGVQDGDFVDLRIDGDRPTTFHGLKVRVTPKEFNVNVSAVHLDYDEFNAAGIFKMNYGYVSKPEE